MAREYMTPEERQAVERGDKWLREQLLGAAAPTRNRQMEDDQVYDENGELPPVSTQGGALSSVAPGTVIPGLGKVPTVAEYYGQIGQTGTDLDAFWAQVQRDRKAQYEAATEALKQRRFGPSKGEQLLALAAAIGRPTLDRSFGSIMANVTPALADIAATNRTAEQERFAAAQALRDKYLSDTQATQFNVLQQKQKNTAAFAPLIAAQLRGPSTGMTYDAPRGIWVNRNNPRPTENTYTIPGTRRTLVQWQDGLWREQLPNGNYRVFERAGNAFNEIEGAS